MQQVGNQFRIAGVRQCCTHHAGSARLESGHGVEQMGKPGSAVLQRLYAIFITAQGMSDLHPHPGFAEGTHHFKMAGNFRGDRNQFYRRHRTQARHFLQGRFLRKIRLGAKLSRIDIGAFQMHAEHARSARAALAAGIAASFQRLLQIAERRRHGSRKHAGSAMPSMDRRDDMDRVAAIHDVFAAAAMYVQIDESGQDVRIEVIVGIDRCAFNRADAAVEMQDTVKPALRG